MNTRSRLPSLKLSARAAARGLLRQQQDENGFNFPRSLRISRWALAISLFANLILIVWIWGSPDNQDAPTDRPKYTQQEIHKAVKVLPGMGKDAVTNLLGEPIVKEFSNNDEEWHYCKTGKVVDEYVVISFQNDKAISLQHYTVSTLDATLHYGEQIMAGAFGAGGWGDCRLGVRWGTYNQKMPDSPELQPAHTRKPSHAASAP